MRRTPFNRGWETRPHANFFVEMMGAGRPWQPVTLPHDATLGEERDATLGPASGFFPGGVYEYRTTFAVPEAYPTSVSSSSSRASIAPPWST